MVPRDENRDSLNRGDVIGGYEVEGLIADGGMASVYRARKELLQRTVAIKLLRPCFAADPKFLRRFVREARLAARLEHPSIVKVFDVGDEDGRYYIVMEYLEGCDLRNMVENHGPFSYRKALRVIRQVAEGLTFAHEQGIIHRDIKPANIILTTSGEAKIADFGLARASQPDQQVTTAGQILGTIAYMSPEQCRGDTLDARSDLYSLGATLYMLLSGRPPFQGHPSAVMLHQVIQTEPPPIQALVENVPADVANFVKRLMAKHPGARLQSGREVVDQINRIIASKYVFAEDSRERSVESFLPEVHWFGWARNVLLAACFGVCVYLLWPHLANLAGQGASATGTPRNGNATDDGGVSSLAVSSDRSLSRPAHHNTELRENMAGLQDDLLVRDTGAVHSYFAPAVRDRPGFVESIHTLLETIRAKGLEAESFGVRDESEEEAKGFLSFLPRGGGPRRMIYVHWVRVNGKWLILQCVGRGIDTGVLGANLPVLR